MIGGFGLPLLALISGVTTYIQMKMVSPNTKDPTQSSMIKMMPIMFAYITYTVPAGLAIYWIVGNLFTIVQQYIMLKNKPVQKEA
ncbi:MAG: oxaAA, partial [Clostridia bacterium]|jgi:YidC/Oxa1 family membrane protein insertase|nr:oxaAA [Clostridia bacterium]